MLPDYPEIKSKIKKIIERRIKSGTAIPPLDVLQEKTLFEGDKHKTIPSDGSTRVTDFKEFVVDIPVNLSEFEQMTDEQMLRKVDEASAEMAEQKAKHFFEVMKQAVENVGNAIDAKGEELGAEHVLKLIEAVQLDFKEDGTHQELTFISGPAASAKFLKALNEVDNTPELKKRMEKLIEKKRIEWNDRESSRKLVG